MTDPATLKEKQLAERILGWAEGYAERNGWKLNPDREELDTVIHGLARNKIRYGKQYCPCRIISGDIEVDKKIICPCTYHRDEIEKDGHCYCTLFFRKE